MRMHLILRSSSLFALQSKLLCNVPTKIGLISLQSRTFSAPSMLCQKQSGYFHNTQEMDHMPQVTPKVQEVRLNSFFADIASVTEKRMHEVSVFQSKVPFPASLCRAQRTMPAPNVFLLRTDPVSVDLQERTLRKLMEGDVVLWAGTPGIGKSQSMNKVLLDLLPKLQEGSLRAVFFRIDERLFKLSVDKDKSPSVKHVNCGESYEEQAKCVGQSMGTKYDGWPTKPMTDVVFVADAYANEHMKLEKFSCGTLIIIANKHLNRMLKCLSYGNSLTKCMVPVMSVDQAQLCGLALYDADAASCQFAYDDATGGLLDRDTAARRFRQRIATVGPVLQHLCAGRQQYREHISDMKFSVPSKLLDLSRRDENVGHISPALSTLLVPQFPPGGTNKNIYSLQWAAVSPYAVRLIASNVIQNPPSAVCNAVQSHITTLALDAKTVDQEFNPYHWDFCVDTGANVPMCSEAKLSAMEAARVLQVLRRCSIYGSASIDGDEDRKGGEGEGQEGKVGKGVEYYDSVLCPVQVQDMQEGVLYVSRSPPTIKNPTTHGRSSLGFLRFFRVGNLCVALQEANNQMGGFPNQVDVQHTLRVLQALGITAENEFKLLLVHVTDAAETVHYATNGLRFQFGGRPSTAMGCAEWRRLAGDTGSPGVSAAAVAPAEGATTTAAAAAITTCEDGTAVDGSSGRFSSAVQSLTTPTTTPTPLPVTPVATSWIPQHKLMTLIVRATFFPRLPKQTLLPLKDFHEAHVVSTLNGLDDRAHCLRGQKRKYSEKRVLALVKAEKARLLAFLGV